MATSETELEDLLDDDSNHIHLACACRPTLTHCGKYQPGITGVDLVSVNDALCPGCLKVWETVGCGACPCGPGAICGACIQSATDIF